MIEAKTSPEQEAISDHWSSLADGVIKQHYTGKTDLLDSYSEADQLGIIGKLIDKREGLIVCQYLNQIQTVEGQEQLLRWLSDNNFGSIISFGIERNNFDKVEGKKLIDTLISSGSGTAIVRLIEGGKVSIDPENFENPTIKKFAQLLIELANFKKIGWEAKAKLDSTLNEFINTCGLNPTQTIGQWAENYAFPPNYEHSSDSYSNFMSNLEAMAGIESKRPGGVRELYDKYGIEMFGRYGHSVLLKQLELANDTSRHYGVMFFPKADFSGAFYSTLGSDYERDIARLDKQLDPYGYTIRIAETGTKTSLYHRTMNFDRLYNRSGENKIKFLILVGHGSYWGINLGRESGTISENVKINQIDLRKFQFPEKQGKDFAKKHQAFEKFINCFDDGIDIILHSCKTGETREGDKNFAQTLQTLVGSRVTAPKQATAPTHIIVKMESDKIHLEQYFAGPKERYGS